MHDIVNEFSRLFPVSKLKARAQVLSLEAKPGEREALASRFELQALDSLKATLELEPRGNGALLFVRGQLVADLVQSCSLSGEPVISHLDEPFEILYSFDPVEEAGTEVLIDLDAEDPPEAVDPGGIDFGEAVAQQLAVMLDPYPRAQNALWEGESVDEAPDEEEPQADKRSPFAVLKELQDKK